MNKKIVLAFIPCLLSLSIPPANASRDSGYMNTQVNPQAWHEFRRAKQTHYQSTHQLAHSPFPSHSSSTNIIKVDLNKRAWGAYDHSGNLVRWGAASGGKAYCPDVGRSCRTVTGTFTFYRKQGANCKSSVFPVNKGGAPMPYCMHFKGGYALHGGNVPDFNASHGCVRVPFSEAQWLNQNFVKVGSTRISVHY